MRPVRKLSSVGRLPRMNSEPISCRRPFIVGPRSFIRKGTPAKKPSARAPALNGSSTASSNSSTTALSSGLTLATPAAACAASSAAVTSPRRTRPASATASCATHSSQLIAKLMVEDPC
jgi:hypothetical protein